MRKVLAAAAFALALVSSCAAITGLEPPEHEVGVEAGGPEGSTPGDATVDQATMKDVASDVLAEADAPTCATSTETLNLARDGNLTFGGSHQDLSAVTVCNLKQLDCLVAFQLTQSAGKQIVSVTLTVPRATSGECGSPCTGATFHEAGMIAARQMRTDWTSDATWIARTSTAADTWGTDGALGATDSTAPLTTAAVAAVAPTASITIAGSQLKPAFNDGTLAFRLNGDPAFQFVLQRKIGANQARATLLVTYCNDANDGG